MLSYLSAPLTTGHLYALGSDESVKPFTLLAGLIRVRDAVCGWAAGTAARIRRLNVRGNVRRNQMTTKVLTISIICDGYSGTGYVEGYRWFGNQRKGLFAAVHESAAGTFETFRLYRGMSAFRGNPEDICSH